LILHQLDARRSFLPNGLPGSPGSLTLSFGRISLSSVMAFAGAWSGWQTHTSWSLLNNPGETRQEYSWKRGDSGWTHIQHHFRFLEIFHVTEMENTSESSSLQGIRCNRIDGTLQLPHGHKLKAFEMIEGRYTVAVTASLTLRSPVYSMALLFEDRNHDLSQKYDLSRFSPQLDQKSWQESNLQLGIYCKGIAIFQLALFKVIKRYSDAWTRSLDAIDQMVQVQVCWHRDPDALEF